MGIRFELVASAVIFVFFAAALALPHALSSAAVVLLLISLTYLLTHRDIQLEYDDDKAFLIAIVAYPLVLIILLFTYGGHWSGVDYTTQMIVALPIVFLVRNIPISKNVLTYSILMGACFAGLFALWEAYVNHAYRVGGYLTQLISYGQIAALLTIFSIAIVLLEKNKYKKALYLIALTLGFTALSLSGTRGALVGLILGLLALLFYTFKWQLKSTLLLLVFTSLAAFIVAKYSPVGARLAPTVQVGIDYIKTGQHPPLNARLNLWEVSLGMQADSPLVGVGAGNFKAELIKSPLNVRNYHFDHPHSQYFDTLVNHGLIGLFFLMVSFFVPLFLFIRRFKQSDKQCLASLLGIALIVTTLGSAITQPLYQHSIAVTFYVVSLMILWGMSAGIKERGS